MPARQKTPLVLGLGPTGLSVVSFLAGRYDTLIVVDSREAPPGLTELQQVYPSVVTYLGSYDFDALIDIAFIVKSPGVAQDIPLLEQARALNIPVVGDIELFARHNQLPLVAITGSNAKSTVTTIVGQMASASGLAAGVAGNIGLPALNLITDAEQTYDVAVLELSSFQLETTDSLEAEVACVLNVSPDHMDRYDNFESYRDTKLRIYQGAKKIVINRDDDTSLPKVMPVTGVYDFGLTAPLGNHGFGVAQHEDTAWLMQGETRLMPVADVKLKGQHNIQNALAALAIGVAMGWPMAPMLQVLRDFGGLPLRCEVLHQIDSVYWINDSKGTNVGATLAAVKGLGEATEGKLVLIAGGDGKNADFSDLRTPVADYVRQVIVFGHDALNIEAAVSDVVTVVRANTLEDAVNKARLAAIPGDTVLFSPACASFDMFENYKVRGERFTQLVDDMVKKLSNSGLKQ